ncbi:MAG: heavy metal translocating P-type ATPase metal-binding domain-containing protein [Ignavibacteriales bacterium]|nr:heavy metal translocating P-type ATPase metal-binding domain-containing protein [Ignavibacteriales bacterium]
MERTAVLEHNAETKLICYHCGDECADASICINEKTFCCNGCKTVFEILSANNLCNYYSIDQNPGITRKNPSVRNYDFLDDTDLKNKLVEFTDGKTTSITFSIPQMHCSSCIWILENLNRLESGIIISKVNFLQKKLFVRFSESETSIKKIVERLDSIGYEPIFNLEEKDEHKIKSDYKKLYYKIGIAGFAFGNIMLLSFPEYLSSGINEMPELKRIFSYINVLLALPVFFYCSSDYFISSYKGLKNKIINLDVPLALGIAVLFFRSVYEIVTNTGAGYMDSLAGLLLFLLSGKLFQSKTYETLNFERNYKSFFPIAVTIKKDSGETTIPVEKIKPGSRIIVHSGELIPADAVLIKGTANIDYSFVTGESAPVLIKNGEMIFAGGKQTGSVIELEIVKEVNQSYLTQLWNHQAFAKNDESVITSLANSISKYFTPAILLISIITGIFWWFAASPANAFNAATAILIVACPCALAMSTPFTLGNALRILGRNKFYLKNTHVIEKIASIDTIVFDKTGTITENGSAEIIFEGEDLSGREKSLIKSAVRNSTHPLSKSIYEWLKNVEVIPADHYEEETGKGIHAVIDGEELKIGSADFCGSIKTENGGDYTTKVYLSFDRKARGCFKIANKYREGLHELISSLDKNYNFAILSGDNEGEKENLKKFFGKEDDLYFRQSPHDKLNFINKLRQNGKKVLMIGDGLNDAGALKQSDVGISITDNINNFSPSSDGILDSNSFAKLADFISFSITGKKIIVISFILSFLYNAAGLFFAIQNLLTPIIAAILMPLSSISVVLFTTLAVNFIAKRKGLI